MKHTRRLQLTAAISCVLLLAAALVFFYTRGKHPKTVPIDAETAAVYAKYEVQIPGSGTAPVTALDILPLCEEVEQQNLNGSVLITCASQALPGLLPQCQSLDELYSIRSENYQTLGIVYTAYDGAQVHLTYGADGLLDKLIYDEARDIAAYLSRDKQEYYLNFRNGS